MKKKRISPLPASSGMQWLNFDVGDAMTGGFLCSLRMPLNPLFKLTLDQIVDFIHQKRPTMRHRQITIELAESEMEKLKKLYG